MKNKVSKTAKPKTSNKASNLFAGSTIIICLVVGYLIWQYVMGNPANFQGGDNHNMPLEGNILGMIYKGGFIVPCLMGLLLMTIVVSIERFFVLKRAQGKNALYKFVEGVREKVSVGDIATAKAMCDEQKGSVGNVIKAALLKYDDVTAEGLDSDKAAEVLDKEISEATSLEMPSLEKNMMILATMVSIGTLLGLLGTVTGMIKAFSGLAVAGTPDSAALATGISEALVNTATGIGTSFLATVTYNFFTSKIDTLTYFIDEAGASIIKAYGKSRKNK
jgi:biopolymer transport protein ExbB